MDFLDLLAVFRSFQGDIRYLETLCQVIREERVNIRKRMLADTISANKVFLYRQIP